MTEADWLTSTNPQAMLSFLRDSGRLSVRKGRLFASAATRRIWHLLTDQRSRKAVEIAEAYLDGKADSKARSKAQGDAHQAAGELNLRVAQALSPAERKSKQVAAMAASAAAAVLQDGLVWQYAASAQLAAAHAAYAAAVAVKFAARVKGLAARPSAKAERAAQCLLLRCIVANPFHPLPSIPASMLQWNQGVVLRLAEQAYEHRIMPAGTLEPDRLAVLADALEEAGAEAALIAHLREAGPYWRGCHVVDALLAKQ
jgi:hypothetical protein